MVETMEIESVEQEKEKSRNDRQLKTFFSTLIHLEQLKLGKGTSSLINLGLSLRIARSDLPQLRTLEIEIPTDWKKPFDSKIYRYLNSYPSLRTLRLTIFNDLPFSCNMRGGEKLDKIKELSLRGTNADHISTLSFIDNFVSLESLSLETLDYASSYPALVSILPTSLTSLSLRNDGAPYTPVFPCEQHFPRLVNLESLYVGRGTLSANPIPSFLHLPKLKTLGFGLGAMLNSLQLEELLLGPERHTGLEKVILDQAGGKIGWEIEKDEGFEGLILHPEHSKEYAHTGPGWIVPEFLSSEFDDKEVKALVEKIRKAEIQVEGTIDEDLKTWSAWCYEVVWCELAQVLDAGNFDEIRERNGDEYVEEFKDNWELDEYDGMVIDRYLVGECEW